MNYTQPFQPFLFLFVLMFLGTPPINAQNYFSNTCENLTFRTSSNTLQISGLTNGYNKVEIIGAPTDWKIVEVCTYCDSEQLIPNLADGDYTVKVNMNTQTGGYCYREEKISINANDGPPATSIIGELNCQNLTFFGGYNQIELSGLTAHYNKVQIIGQPTNWQVQTLCDGNCLEYQLSEYLPAGSYTVKVNQKDRNGRHCYQEEKITVQESDGTPNQLPTENDISCDFLTFRGSSGQIYIDGLTAFHNKVEYIGVGTNWRVITLCDGDCYSDERIFDLPEGYYKVKVNQRGIDGSYCYRENLVQVYRSSTNRNSLAHQDGLVLYPNPVRKKLNLTLSSFEEPVELKIYNAFGHLVKTIPKQTIGDNTSIDLTSFENGLYLLSIFRGNSKVVSKRFLVEHLR